MVLFHDFHDDFQSPRGRKHFDFGKWNGYSQFVCERKYPGLFFSVLLIGCNVSKLRAINDQFHFSFLSPRSLIGQQKSEVQQKQKRTRSRSRRADALPVRQRSAPMSTTSPGRPFRPR